MKKYFIAAVLVVAFATPSLAMQDYYVALRVGGGGCEVMMTAPTDMKMYKMMGKYSSEADAKKAMGTMKECK